MARRVVFWDFDGTLARRDGLFAGALIDAWSRVARPTATREEIRPFLTGGFPWHAPDIVIEPLTSARWWERMRPVFVGAFTGVGASRDVAESAAALVAAEFYRLDAWAVVDGAEHALQLTRSAGYDNVILSNHGPELPELVAALGLSRWVERTVTSAAVGAEKPNPKIFQHARVVADAGADAWMVGDNPLADVQGAEGVGLRAILADGAYPDARGMTVLEAARRIVSTATAGSLAP
ncbi:HAD-IA family hydrolase [Microbacterium sp. LTA6]|uniref:HAD family hydrolase n=1 Tax=Microbacterium sp. LTA6 TaxID=3129771 RepID=UPI00324606E9